MRYDVQARSTSVVYLSVEADSRDEAVELAETDPSNSRVRYLDSQDSDLEVFYAEAEA